MAFPRRRTDRARLLAGLAALGLAVVVLLGFFGDLATPLDTLSQFRAHAALALASTALVLLVCRSFAAGTGSLLLALLALYSVLPFWLTNPLTDPPEGAPVYKLLQMNLRFDAPDPSAALRVIAETKPDVIAAQELTGRWQALLEKLATTYPYRYYCGPQSQSVGDVAILSRRPFVGTTDDPAGGRAVCDQANDFAARTVDFNGMPVTIATQHLRWPWPFPQDAMLDALSKTTLPGLRDPLIVAGDFNAVPWSATVRRYADETGTRILAGVGPTWLSARLPGDWARYVGLPIDNILVSHSIEVLDVKTLKATTSDHLPILVTFTMRFALPDAPEPDMQSASR